MLVEQRLGKLLVARLIVAWLSCAALSAHAVNVPDLYEVTIPIEAGRDTAFVEALRAVAVRVSGRRDAAARLGPAANSPRQYVQRFAFTSDNQLQVAFDSGSVDRLLSESGLSVWGRERPATLVLLSVQGADGSQHWVDGGYASAERDALARVAKQRGVPLVWPSLSGQDRAVLSGNPSAPDLLQLAVAHNANAVLLGQARRDGSGAMNVEWTLAAEDGTGETRGSLEEGVHLAADTFGRMFGTSGSLNTVNVELAGIGSLDDYAIAMNYLEGMTLVRSVAVEQVTGDTLRLQLAVRGDAATLRRALSLDSKIVPATVADAAAPSDRLQLRFKR